MVYFEIPYLEFVFLIMFQGQCKNLVDTEGPAIVQLIIQGIETTKICKLLRLCDGSQNELLGDSLTSFEDDINVYLILEYAQCGS